MGKRPTTTTKAPAKVPLGTVLTPARIAALPDGGRDALGMILGARSCQCTTLVVYLTFAGRRYSPARIDRCRRLSGHPGAHWDALSRPAALAQVDTHTELLALSAMLGNRDAAKALQWAG